MGKELNIFGKQKIISHKKLKRIFEIVLSDLDIKEAKINLIFASENKIKQLNKTYRGKDSATDVLSFPYNEESCIGEILICTAKVRKQAKEYNLEPEKEMSKIFIHGLLHLFSYDHIKEKDYIIMKNKEKELLTRIQKI